MKKIFLVASLLCAVCVLSSNFISADSEQPITEHDIAKLNDGFHIKLDDDSTIPDSKVARIDKNTAIQNASEVFPSWASDATKVKVEYHLVTNDLFSGFSPEALDKNPELKAKGHMDRLPVYIVSFSGMTYYSHSPKSGTPGIHHEYNVIVDAITGVALEGFSYR